MLKSEMYKYMHESNYPNSKQKTLPIYADMYICTISTLCQYKSSFRAPLEALSRSLLDDRFA